MSDTKETADLEQQVVVALTYDGDVELLASAETDKGQEGSWFHSLLCDLSPQEPASRAVHPSKTDIE